MCHPRSPSNRRLLPLLKKLPWARPCSISRDPIVAGPGRPWPAGDVEGRRPVPGAVKCPGPVGRNAHRSRPRAAVRLMARSRPSCGCSTGWAGLRRSGEPAGASLHGSVSLLPGHGLEEAVLRTTLVMSATSAAPRARSRSRCASSRPRRRVRSRQAASSSPSSRCRRASRSARRSRGVPSPATMRTSQPRVARPAPR